MRPSEVTRLEVTPRPWVFPALRNLSVDLAATLGTRTALRLFWGVDPDRLARPDVIVGSGRPAVPLGILLARHFRVPHVFSGTADRMRLAGAIDLRLVPTPSFAGEANVEVTPVPSLVAPDTLPVPRPLTREADLAGARIGLLLGGDAHSHRFGTADWRGIADLVVEMRRRFGVSWIVSDSRRTGAEGAAIFRALAEDGVVDRFVDRQRPETGGVADLFAADALIVTEDSVSMMSEAVAARRPVVALRPGDFEPTLVDEIVGTLVDTGALAALPIAGTSADDLARRLVTLTPIGHDHRDLIAAALLRRLPGLFAGGAGR